MMIERVAKGSSLWGSRTEQKAFTAVPPRNEEEGAAVEVRRNCFFGDAKCSTGKSSPLPSESGSGGRAEPGGRSGSWRRRWSGSRARMNVVRWPRRCSR